MNEQNNQPSLLPIMLQLKDELVVIVGGGKVATRRIRSLLPLEVRVIVISPKVTADIARWHEQNRLHWKEKEFTPLDIQDAKIIIAATNKAKVNERVYEARSSDQLVNLVDRPDLSDFFFPAIVRRGKLLLSISTSGASPTLTKQIKKQLEKVYTNDYESYVHFLHTCRRTVQAAGLCQSTRNYILKQLLHSRFRHMDRAEREKEFQHLLEIEGGKRI